MSECLGISTQYVHRTLDYSLLADGKKATRERELGIDATVRAALCISSSRGLKWLWEEEEGERDSSCSLHFRLGSNAKPFDDSVLREREREVPPGDDQLKCEVTQWRRPPA